MLEAVLFDWGDTLFHFAYDDELLEAGWAAGLAAMGRDDLPEAGRPRRPVSASATCRCWSARTRSTSSSTRA